MIPVDAIGDVTLRPRHAGDPLNPYQTSVVVGAAPQWGDDSDGTYATAWRSGRTVNETEDAVDIARGTFGTLTMDPADVLDITLHFRASTSGGAARTISATLYGETMGFILNFGESSSTPYYNVTADAAIHDYASPLTPEVLAYSATTTADVAWALANDVTYIEFARLRSNGAEAVPYDSEITVYKVWLEVNGNVIVSGIPAIRHMQRGDGELLSTAPRAFQHNSVQGSLRNLSYL